MRSGIQKVGAFDLARFIDQDAQRFTSAVQTVVRISAIVDACFSLIVDGVSARSWTRWGSAQAMGSLYLNRPRSD